MVAEMKRDFLAAFAQLSAADAAAPTPSPSNATPCSSVGMPSPSNGPSSPSNSEAAEQMRRQQRQLDELTGAVAAMQVGHVVRVVIWVM